MQSMNLATILEPLTVETFFSQYWEKQAIAIQNKTSPKFQEWFTWTQFNHLLNFHRLRYPDDIRFNRDGETLPPVNPKEWRKQLQEGATLILNHVHELDPKIAALAAVLRYELGHPVQVNLYCTPDLEQGFDCHYDTHDVIILQVDGEKEWFVLRETIPFPSSYSRSATDLPPDEPPYLKTILKPGDVLYIPRGHWHYAVPCGDRPSLHLTLGMSCQTGLDWLQWLERQLRDRPQWRQNLPVWENGNTAALEKRLQALGQALAQELTHETWVKKYAQAWFADEVEIAPFALPQQLGLDIFAEGLETCLQRSPTQHLRLEMTSDHSIRVKIGAKQLDFRSDAIDVLKWIFERDRFSLLELAEIAPDLDWDSAIAPLLTQLVTEGVLTVVS